MNQGYLSRTWQAMRSTRSWLGIVCLLGLVALIPVFGVIVVQGYLYGWARDAAWNMNGPLPRRIFGNEDGALYRRGFFALVISVVFWTVVCLGAMFLSWVFTLASAGVLSVVVNASPHASSPGMVAIALPSLIGTLGLALAGVAVAFAVQLFIWVATMRTSIYGTLSAGFQLSCVWAMVRKDPVGLCKIFLGQFVALLAVGFVFTVIWCVVVFVGVFVSMMIVGAVDFAPSASAFDGLAALGTLSTVVFALVAFYASLVCGILIQAFVCRSLGYWTSQFDVASWGAQDDPLPFETARLER